MVMNRMPFFPRASGFTINDSHLYQVGGDFNIHFAIPAESTERITTQLLGKRKERDLDKGDAEADGPRKRFEEVRDEIPSPDGLMTVHPKDIDLQRQLTSGSNHCTHSAIYEGRIVAVKVFHGPRAKQSWKFNLTLAKNFL
ncbi:uncharacterized protein LACBIDRAFT_302898 [Laccaria bicolor S238N-H82]|uniref:Predicted protein n=1 Tax=Laccaria bicolor (strain S238N-H82 / ATCC MYA-4686) TaxID=486041 RepID=B0DIK3_LACBS|nr:uncharacterized protein LACBIDRAFT_302898 [Laccaria bicolor S238N-H82]EDR05582.1 predicted protein [Laccaria bicolor S238N-H82]|eukprot:XP_001883686.1 predicted protein [Laccaria bicolor S238N-H82]